MVSAANMANAANTANAVNMASAVNAAAMESPIAANRGSKKSSIEVSCRAAQLLAPRLLFPLAGGRLLEIDQLVAGFLVGLPALAGGRDGDVVIAVEHLAHQREVAAIGAGRAIAQDQQTGGVGILGLRGEIDRLRAGKAVLCRSVRQETLWPVGPQVRRQRFDALRRACHHQCPIAPTVSALEDHGERVLEARALQMIEADLAHRLSDYFSS